MTIAWISEFPIEWLTDLPEPLRGLPRQHPATWMPVLLEEFRRKGGLKLHVITLRNNVAADLDHVVLKALAKDPARRYPTVDALLGDLFRFRHRMTYTILARD